MIHTPHRDKKRGTTRSMRSCASTRLSGSSSIRPATGHLGASPRPRSWQCAHGQSGQIKEADGLDPPAVDQRTLYEGNSILRGGREPRVEEPQAQRAVEALVIE